VCDRGRPLSIIGFSAVALANTESWSELASCRETGPDDETWFPEAKWGRATDAKRIFQRCPVRRECLEYALKHGERFGVWGGLTSKERQVLRRNGRPPRKPALHQPNCICAVCRRMA
jgi:WhiB family redox-sensing transcriptional regulator